MRCLVTGADGFVGRHLCRRLVLDGHEVVAMHPVRWRQRDVLPECVHEMGDITDPAYVQRVVTGTDADWVFHLAAAVSVQECEHAPAHAFAVNVGATVTLLDALRIVPRPKAIVVSTSDKAYGSADAPYTEDTALRPVGAYETSKACQDYIAMCYGRMGLPVRVVRCANIYGPDDTNQTRLVPKALALNANGLPVTIYGNAQHMQREWLHVDDAAYAMIRVARAGEDATAYNVGSGDTATPFQVATIIANLMGAPNPAIGDPSGLPEIQSQSLDCSRIRQFWEPQFGVIDGMKHTVNEYRSGSCAF